MRPGAAHYIFGSGTGQERTTKRLVLPVRPTNSRWKSRVPKVPIFFLRLGVRPSLGLALTPSLVHGGRGPDLDTEFHGYPSTTFLGNSHRI